MELIIAVVLALLSYFTAKKKGASTAQAGLAAAAVGAGAYYVATETDWGKSFFEDADSAWEIAYDDNGEPIVDANGRPVYVPVGEKAVVDESGYPVISSDGSWFTKTLDTTGKVLTSWGGAGTAAVIGTTGAVTGAFGDLSKYLPWILIAGAIVLLK